MFFVFQILLLLIVFTSRVHSSPIQEYKYKDSPFVTTTPKNWKLKDVTTRNATSFATHKLLFDIIKNLTSTTPNLKSNVFDKMLSDEMLSIKHHFHEKDSRTALVTKASKIHPCTPFLVMKQRWPFIQFDLNAYNALRLQESWNLVDNDNSSKSHFENQSISSFNNQIDKDNGSDKVLGLRSLDQVTSYPGRFYHGDDSNMCTCVKNPTENVCGHDSCNTQMCTHSTCAPSTYTHVSCEPNLYTQSSCAPHTCTHTSCEPPSLTHCAGVSSKCTHSSCTHSTCTHSTCTHNKCTQSICTQSIYYTQGFPDMPVFSTAYIVTYQPFFIGITQSPYKHYYHPDVINEIKSRKRKKSRKTTKVYVDEDLYYDSKFVGLSHKKEDNDDEDLQYDDQLTETNSDEIVTDQPKSHKVSFSSKLLKLQHIEHDRNKKTADAEKTIDDLVNDLKMYYSDSVIKDCYCSYSDSYKYCASRSTTFIVSLLILWLNQ